MKTIQKKSENTNQIKKKRITPIYLAIIVVFLILIALILFLLLRGTPASDILLFDDSIELVAGNTHMLNYEILPSNVTNKSVKWKSSNPSIAGVNEIGEVTAIRKGEAVITISTANGKIDECLITVKPTAFDYLKELCDSTNGYTVGTYNPSSGSTVSIGISFNSTENSIYLMNDYQSKESSSISAIIIPNTCNGEYKGYLEFDYGYYFKYGGLRVVHSTYLIDADSLTKSTNLKSESCDGDSFQVPQNEDIYTANVHAMLSRVYNELLEPNGYTYADLGFNSY